MAGVSPALLRTCLLTPWAASPPPSVPRPRSQELHGGRRELGAHMGQPLPAVCAGLRRQRRLLPDHRCAAFFSCFWCLWLACVARLWLAWWLALWLAGALGARPAQRVPGVCVHARRAEQRRGCHARARVGTDTALVPLSLPPVLQRRRRASTRSGCTLWETTGRSPPSPRRDDSCLLRLLPGWLAGDSGSLAHPGSERPHLPPFASLFPLPLSSP